MVLDIPLRFRNNSFRFVFLTGKRPFEDDWQNTANYEWTNPKIREHNGNLGIILGYGGLCCIDCDTDLLKDLSQLDTFIVKTGGQGEHYHIYFTCKDFEDLVNHQLADGKSDFRCWHKQCVLPPSIHPDTGKKYVVFKDRPIKEMSATDIKLVLKKYQKNNEAIIQSLDTNKIRDESRSGKEFSQVCYLIRKGCSKEKIWQDMKAYAKWSGSPEQYREHTYKAAMNKANINNPKEILKVDVESKLIDFEVLQTMDIPPIRYLVEGYIPIGLTYIGGDSGSLKSYLAQHLTMCAITGNPFLGQFPIENLDNRPILYIDEENRISTLKERLVKLKKGMPKDDKVCKLFTLIDAGIKFDAHQKGKGSEIDQLNLTEFKIMVAKYKPQIVVFDSFIRFFLGDENFSSDVRQVFDTIKAIMNENDCSCIVLHHTSKNTGNGKSSLRGSGDIPASADSIIMMSYNANYKNYTLTHVKSRNTTECESLILKLNAFDDKVSIDFVKDATNQKVSALDQLKRAIKDWCKDNKDWFKTGTIKDALIKEGFSDTNYINKALNSLVEDGDLEKGKKQGFWKYNPPFDYKANTEVVE